MLIAICWPGAMPDNAAAESQFDLETIRKELQEWRSSFVNVHIEYRSTGDPHSRDAIAANRVGIPVFVDTEWTWCDDGRLRYHTVTGRNDQPRVRTLMTADGRSIYNAYYDQSQLDYEKPQRVGISPQRTGTLTSPIAMEPVFGLYQHNLGIWLSDTFDHPDCSVELLDDADYAGRLMPRIRLVRRTDRGDREGFLTLDPEHQMLPRVVEQGWRNEVFEFQEIDGISFPRRGRFVRSGDSPEWEVRVCRFNQTYSDSFFQPPKARTPTPVTVTVPRPSPAQLADAARGNLPASEVPSARPVKVWTWWLQLGLLVAAGGAGIAGAMLYYRRSARRA